MNQNIFTIFTGDDKTMTMKAVYKDTLDPLDLSLCTEIDIALPLASGLFSHRLLSLGQVVITLPSILGKFTCEIPASISAQMNIGEYQNIDVTFTIGTKIITIRFMNVLSVFERN